MIENKREALRLSYYRGNIEQALKAAYEILDLKPLDALTLLFLSDKNPPEQISVDIKSAYKKRHYLGSLDKIYIMYAMAKTYEAEGETEKAFKTYTEAGDTINKLQSYNRVAAEEYFSFLKSLPPAKKVNTGKKIIFIVGLPRSGSTLLETMIGAHSQVTPNGEKPAIKDFLEISQKVTFNVDAFIKECDGHPYAVNKFLYNFQYIPMIQCLDAYVIHLNRRPYDLLFSCFTTLFNRGNEWTYKLEDLAHYYKLYCDLMKFWEGKYSFLNVQYEELVNSPEDELKRVLNYCNLEFEPQCLKHYKSNRIIETASAAQARKPLYSTAVGRSEAYKKYLQPLIRTLRS